MAKTSNIVLRIDEEAKRRIAEAARRTGKNLSSFTTEAVMEAVENAERGISKKEPKSARRSGACPTFFRAACATAMVGGTTGYNAAAYELTRNLPTLGPYEMTEAEWNERLDQLGELLSIGFPGSDEEENANGQIVAWFEANLPRCMALVPVRRRDSFVKGVRAFREHEG
jgi:hypothetical protein